MKRGGPLRRLTPLRRGKRLPAQSRKRKAELEARRDVRMAVFDRDGHRCVLAARVLLAGERVPACFGPITPHHLRKASAGGPYTPDNLVTLCAGHNEWVENAPLQASALGLVIR